MADETRARALNLLRRLGLSVADSDHPDARVVAQELEDAAATARAERDEARDWVRRMHAEAQVLTCVFCGESYPPGTAASGEPALVAHVEKCPKHPLAACRTERDAEKARADRLSDARQELGVERDMLKMENEQLRASLDTRAAEVAQLRGLLREWWPEDREPHSVLARCPAAPPCLVCRTQDALAPVGAPLAGRPEGIG